MTRHIVKAQNLAKAEKECDSGCPERVTFRCHQCSLDLCSRCAHSHPRNQRFKDHNVVNVRDVGPADVAIPIECHRHPGRMMEAYCLPCVTLVCSKCFLPKTSTHATHARESLEVVGARVQADLTPLLLPRGQEDPLMSPLGDAIDKVKETRAALAAHLTNQLDNINTQEEAAIMRVKDAAKVKRDEIIAAGGRTEAALKAQEAALRQHGALLRQLNDYTHALLAMVKGSELVEVGSVIKGHLEEARSLKAEDVRPVAVPARFPTFVPQKARKTSSALGKIVEPLIAPWTMGRKGTPRAIYVLEGLSHDTWQLREVHRFDLQMHAWEVQPDKSVEPRYASAVARNGCCVYVMGGGTDTGVTATMERLDITKADARWMPCAPLSMARIRLAAASIEGFIYAFGGCHAHVVPVSTVERYDPVMDTWTACAPMRNGLTCHAPVAVKKHIYVLGGLIVRDDEEKLITAHVDRYDPGANTWTACAPMGIPRAMFVAAGINGSIIVAGGVGSTEPLASVELYDIASNTWTTRSPMPTARRSMAGCVVGASLYVLGGSSTLLDETAVATVERYDVDADRWEPCPPMPQPLYQVAAMAW